MKFPNKLYDYKESILYDSFIVLNNLKGEMTVLELLLLCKKEINGVQEFYDALAVLYAIKKIEYNFETGRIYCVSSNNLR